MGLNRDLFNFSAKVGCLEGYLYERKDADVSTLPNWVGNIEKMYRNLPIKVKRDFLEDYKTYSGKDPSIFRENLEKRGWGLNKAKKHDRRYFLQSSLKRAFLCEQK